jgi:hypothetical protein
MHWNVWKRQFFASVTEKQVNGYNLFLFTKFLTVNVHKMSGNRGNDFAFLSIQNIRNVENDKYRNRNVRIEGIEKKNSRRTQQWRVEWLIMMRWDWRLRTAATNGPIARPAGWYVSVEPRWWWRRLGITPDSFDRAPWQSCHQRYLEQVGGMDEGMRILRIQCLWYLNWSLTCRKILRRGTSGFTSHPKESVLRIFIALKNPSSQPGLNTRPLGPVASTLTTTPPRRLTLKR